MKTSYKLIFLLPLLALLFLQPIQRTIAQQNHTSPTPTYDPLAEPPLPPSPTEYELGRNLYWHWCMTCHGDRGQGLTDEFREIWDAEHQNCWARGCHAGHSGDMGFPIPTVVPALVNDTHLVQFASVQALSDFLQETHPPQSPGILKNQEYHAIALFVFMMNERPLIDILITATPASTLTPIPTLVPQAASTNSFPIYLLIILAVLVVGFGSLARRARLRD